jgi:CPA2 family monovalent cation:H+ antiporter-2
MFLDPAQMLREPGVLLLDIGAIMLGKILIVVVAGMLLLRRSLRVSLEAGLSLCQMGEFSFVLFGVASQAGLIEPMLHQRVIAASVMTLMISPFLIRYAPERLHGLGSERSGETSADDPEPDARVVVIGYGPAGQTLIRLLRSLEIPFIAVDTNPSALVKARTTGEPIIFGDATRPQVLQHLRVADARLVAVAISDPLATRRIVSRIRAMAPKTPILARTRYVREVDRLSMAGATMVVAEEFEGSIELVARALETFDVPTGAIARFTDALRDEGYDAIRGPAALPIDPWLMELLDHAETEWLEVPMTFIGEASLNELDIRAGTGANVLVIERGTTRHPNPSPDFALQAGDRLLVLGDVHDLARLRRLLDTPRQA